MRITHRLAFTLCVLLIASASSAQTTATASWTQTELPPVASTFQNTLQIDTAAPVPLTATCIAAIAPATGSTCSAPFPLTGPTTNHTYVLIVCNGTFCASASTGGSTPGLGGFKIKVTVTVTSGDDDENEPEAD